MTLMSTRNNIVPIWNTSTGIRDFGAGEAAALAESEILDIRDRWSELQKQLEGDQNLAEFKERLKREWAIETGAIERLYDIDLRVTQVLIEHGFKTELLHHGSTDKPRKYVLQLLKDQEDSLDGIFDFIRGGRSLTISYIKALHASLVRNQDTAEGVDSLVRSINTPLVKGDWKTRDNHPVRNGVKYMYCPREQVGSEMDRLVTLHSSHVQKGVSSEVQAAWLHHRFTQIHPFQDGNGRVARALASLVLIKDGLFPLIITRNERNKYFEALEGADKGDLAPLIVILVNSQRVQFRKASEITKVHIGSSQQKCTKAELKKSCAE